MGFSSSKPDLPPNLPTFDEGAVVHATFKTSEESDFKAKLRRRVPDYRQQLCWPRNRSRSHGPTQMPVSPLDAHSTTAPSSTA